MGFDHRRNLPCLLFEVVLDKFFDADRDPIDDEAQRYPKCTKQMSYGDTICDTIFLAESRYWPEIGDFFATH